MKDKIDFLSQFMTIYCNWKPKEMKGIWSERGYWDKVDASESQAMEDIVKQCQSKQVNAGNDQRLKSKSGMNKEFVPNL